MRYLKFPGHPESNIQIDLNRTNDQLRKPEEGAGQVRKPDIVVLKGRYLDRWHSETINPHSWYEQPLGAKPTPTVVFKTEDGNRCGIVHMRNLDGQRSVCISLVSKAGAWQTGVWLDIEAGDKLAISWFRDWRNTEISAINLEIINAGHEESPGDVDDLIPRSDEIDLGLYAAEAKLEAAAPNANMLPPEADELEASLATEFVAEPVTEPDTVPLDPGASVLICAAGDDENRMPVDSNPWFSNQISTEPVPVANLITDFQQLAGKIYLRKLSDWYEYSLSVVIGDREYLTGTWKSINPDSSLSLSWATDRSGKVVEEFHLEFDAKPAK